MFLMVTSLTTPSSAFIARDPTNSATGFGRAEIAQKIEQHTHGDIRILDRDRLGRIVADAVLAPHEQHADRTQSNHREPAVTRAARQAQGSESQPCDGGF